MACHQEPCPDVPRAPTWIQVISSLQILCQDPRLSELPYQKSNYWCTIALKPDDIDQGPEEVMANLKEMEHELVREKTNRKLTKELEGKNSKRQMQQSLTRAHVVQNYVKLLDNRTNGQ